MANIKEAVVSGSTVIVASKMPMDLIMRLHAPHTVYAPVLGGGVREEKQFHPMPGGDEFVIKGNSYEKTLNPLHGDTFGYALTHNIPKAFWDAWYDQHKAADFIKNGMIFSHSDTASVKSHTRENESLQSGLERLDPKNLPKGRKMPSKAA